MKKIIVSLIIVFGITGVASASWYNPFSWFEKETKSEITLGATYLFPYQGGTGTSTAPTYGQMLVGNSGGTYTLTATSSLGITADAGASADWVKQTNYGVLNLTASTTIPYWAKDTFYASSTSVFQGLATFGNASTTQISATNSYLGTVLSGIWNGTALGNAYVDDDITLTNITQITNRAITDTTGTLTVARGGTGQTSFGQGWLNSDGTTLTSSTSPTVNYLTATSTTATSTFAGGVIMANGAGNVGIGSISPLAKLYTAGNTQTTGEFIEGTGSIVSTAAIIPYIQLTSTANNVPTSTNPFLVTYDNVEEQQIFAFTPTSGHITVPESGVYVVIAGGQVGKVSGSAIRILDLWMRKNDVDIPRSSVRNNIASSADTKVVLNNAGIRLNAGDTVEIYVAVDDITGSTGLYTYSPTGRPSNPSIIFTMYKISQ